MSASTPLNPFRRLHLVLVVASAAGLLTAVSASAQASTALKPFRITAPALRTVGQDWTNAVSKLRPITVTAPLDGTFWHERATGSPQTITVTAPVVSTVAHDWATGEPIQKIMVTARVSFRAGTLRTKAGVAHLGDRVADAAKKACDYIDPLSVNSGCIRAAIASAQHQVAVAISRERNAEVG